VWGRGEVHTSSWWGNLMEIDHLKDPGRDGRIILKWLSRMGMRGLDSIVLALDKDRWRALVNSAMNLRVP